MKVRKLNLHKNKLSTKDITAKKSAKIYKTKKASNTFEDDVEFSGQSVSLAGSVSNK